MLKPLEPCEDCQPFFVVCDIETYAKPHPREGDVLAIDTAWRADGVIKHVKHNTWEEWWSFITDIGENDERFRVIYAHNGGGFDWLSLCEWLLRQDEKKRLSISAACAGSKMITLNVTIQKEFSVHLCDSLQLLRSKLDKLAQVFLGKRKVELGGKLPHEIYESDRALFEKYHGMDTETLLEVMEHALQLVRNNVAKIKTFGFTIGSTALKVFRTMGLRNSISIPTDSYGKGFLRSGYRGGRVECFAPGYYESINVYDINSLYPFVMSKCSVPISDRGFWTERFTGNEELPGVWEIEFNQRDRRIPPVLMGGGNGVYNGRGVFFSPELLLLRKVDPHCEVRIKKGFVFAECDVIFKEFVERLYKLRLADPDGPISMLCKFLMNSLYGKFGQHPERETIIVDSEIDLSKIPDIGESNIRVINPELGVCGMTKKTRVDFEHVGIAGMITSEARVTLYEGIRKANGTVVYCDTDSIHTLGKLPGNMVGRELGQFKLEFSGEGVYAGKKLYALRKPNDGMGNIEKVRAKGVSVGGNFGCVLTFDNVRELVDGKKIVCEFSQFPTPMDIFKGKKSCQLKSRKRTLRRT